jgi:cephalosporin hydroxylase
MTTLSQRLRKLSNPTKARIVLNNRSRLLLNKLQRIERKILTPLIINYFHRLWYSSQSTWQKNYYFGYQISQLPLDMQLYQEIIYAEKPAFIIQTGVLNGGSILYFAHLLDLMGVDLSALVIGIDINLSAAAKTLSHPRIRLIEGSSIAPETIEQIQRLLPAPTGLVSLDSAHQYKHVLRELEIYSQYTAPNCHLVCEDTNINGHPVYPDFGPGPFEAVKDFLKNNPDWIQDDTVWKRNLISFHQYGWLKRLN